MQAAGCKTPTGMQLALTAAILELYYFVKECNCLFLLKSFRIKRHSIRKQTTCPTFLHHTTASLGTSLVLTLIELQWGKFLIFKILPNCICFMKIYITDRFSANFGPTRVIPTCGKFPILIFTIFHRDPMEIQEN